jgi:hypothetical protein
MIKTNYDVRQKSTLVQVWIGGGDSGQGGRWKRLGESTSGGGEAKWRPKWTIIGQPSGAARRGETLIRERLQSSDSPIPTIYVR